MRRPPADHGRLAGGPRGPDPRARGYRARAGVLARTAHYQPVKFPEESLEMLNDADCSIDHMTIAGVLEHVRWDDLAFRGEWPR